MTGPSAPRAAAPWWARPAIVLPAVAALAFLAALFSPVQRTSRSGDPRLSTLSSAPLGASLVHDLAQRLGWRVERRLRPGMPKDPNAIHAILGPSVPLRVTEVGALLKHVRNGGAALVVLGGGSGALSDSLNLRTGPAGRALPVEPKERVCDAKERTDVFMSLWFGAPPQLLSLERTGLPPVERETFVWTTALSSKEAKLQAARRPAMTGYLYGAGRIVVAADPDIFRNDAVRDCDPGFDVAVVRALEFLRAGGAVPRDLVVFDEYHQGHGAHPGSIRAAALYLRDRPSGRLLAQLAIAGFVLLLALAPRTVAPRVDTRVERRSPLEQVDALARAYEQVRATRTAAARLVRGVRRRTQRGVGRDRTALTDDAWLARIAERTPQLAEDVALARRALGESLPSRTFATLGPALHRIETTLTGR